MSDAFFKKIFIFFLGFLLIVTGIWGQPGSYLASIIDTDAMEQTGT